MEEQQIRDFIELVKLESTYKKFINYDIIHKLINIFDSDFTKQIYSNKIKNPLQIALQFYKEYNIGYYNTIIEGIKNKRIVISNDILKSFCDVKNNITYIKLHGDDGDLFNIVHELAHFIDINSTPSIIPNQYWFLSETFAFYIEKKLQTWLQKEKYSDLILTRINNRIYFEQKMLKAIESELYYEDLFRKKGTIESSDIDIEKINAIMQYDTSNIVNYLLQYPIANVLSDYLINNDLIHDDKQLAYECINTDLYKVLEKYSINLKTLS